MKKHLVRALALCVLTVLGCADGRETKEAPLVKEKRMELSPYKDLQHTARNLFGTLPRAAVSNQNEATPEKIALGKALYFEKALSKGFTQSCNTCHNLNSFGVDNQAFSKGNDGGLGGRNSPTTLNAALHFTQFWDGREPDIEAQAGGPILNPVEMAMPDEQSVIRRLAKMQQYQELFGKAFPGEKKPMTYGNLKKAIGAFERQLITPSRFDRYLAGKENALTEPEKEGMQLFIETGCITCHSGNLLGGNMFQKFGLMDDYWKHTGSKKIDSGRYGVTRNPADLYVFKVPSLRNVEKTFPYFHDGSVTDLGRAVDVMARVQTGKQLTQKQTDAIVLFLKSLTGTVPAGLKE